MNVLGKTEHEIKHNEWQAAAGIANGERERIESCLSATWTSEIDHGLQMEKK